MKTVEMIAVASLLSCAAFEIVAWTLDPWGVHLALSDFVEQPLSRKLIPATINSVIFAVPMCGLLYDVGALLAAGIPLITFTFSMFTQFWILPYVANIGKYQMLQEHKYASLVVSAYAFARALHVD